MWYQMRESLHENEIQPQPDPIEGIDNLTLVLMGYLAAVLVAAPITKELHKLTIYIWHMHKITTPTYFL